MQPKLRLERVAVMRDAKMGREIDVFEDEDGALFVRDAEASEFEQVHPHFNPTLNIYLQRCQDNFGFSTEVLS